MNLIIHEIHPEETENLNDWGEKLMTERREEAIKTLEQENVEMEAVFLVELEGKTYFIGIDETGKGGHDPVDMSEDINQKHKKILNKAFKNKKVAEGKLVYKLENKN
ncbi:MAG: DUF6176 family protein [Candidatus Magasanikbacteria bacterium]